MDENHRKFLSHLDASEEAVLVAAQWLRGKGYPVTINPTRRAPSRKDYKEFVDGGDISVAMRVEIKHLTVEFTSREDWPFGDKFIVCARHAYDLASPKPYAFLIFSRSYGAVAEVRGLTRPSWEVEARTDSRYDNVTQDFYFCPLDLVRFEKL